jgi:poly-beta-hydroxyalkanoate depolymerase
LFAGSGLYQFHELWRAGMAPYTYFAEAGAKMFSTPGSWLAGMPEAPRIAAGYELMYRQGLRETRVQPAHDPDRRQRLSRRPERDPSHAFLPPDALQALQR